MMDTLTMFARRTRRGFSFIRLALLVAVLAGPLTGLAQETILYPRSAATAEAPAATRPPGSNATLLLLALAAAAAGGWLLWRQYHSRKGLMTRAASKLSVAETRPLGNRQYLVVADYDGRKFLLGVCPGRIDLLSPLDGSTPPKQP